jgi:hypothetical protein
MLWVTRSRVHLDRVASPWLVLRFVDRDAEFGFVEAGDPVPHGAIGIGIAGAEFGPHDAAGSAFRKILTAYRVQDVALQRMADVVDLGIAIAIGAEGANLSGDLRRHAEALAAFSEAMVVLRRDDREILVDSVPYYDALYLAIWSVYGPAPDAPEGLAARVDAYRNARDWAAVLPSLQWTASSGVTAPRSSSTVPRSVRSSRR